MARVLVVDDDPRLVKVVAGLLRRRGHQVEAAPNGESARLVLRRGGVDIALLDINLPDIDGLSLVDQLRDGGNTTPLILLTVRGEPHEQALGLRLGADDYVAKPFEPEVLLARIQAVLRRSATPTAGRTDDTRGALLDIPPVRVDLAARQVFRDGTVVRLAPMEYALLEFLATNRGRAISKEELMLHVWGTSQGVSRTLAEHVSRLRRKLGEDVIVTVTGFGYLIPAAPESSAATTP
ncbi:response regulator transcription factor [Actinomadura sp. NPDC047616]|uniref:response regulator transcription factor n=1 Tax=Actinomadura sp. NPDC047616 TaxID=3155914 RepID=UPI0033D21650